MRTSFSPPARLRRPASGGFALIIVMFLLALILILVIAFAANMRIERKASHNMAQGQRAELLAQGALAHAVSLLAHNIPDPTDPTIATPVGTATNWYVNPGQLTLIDSATPPNITHIPLHTGTASDRNSAVAANLNAQSPVTQKYHITGTNDPMWVAWVNVLHDASAPASKTNPIAGRYAFWIDDECAKINFNTARGKPADMAAKVALPANWSGTSRDLRAALTPTFTIGAKAYALGQPASVNLDLLGFTPAAIASLDTDVADNGFFAQPQAIKFYASADPDAAAAFYEQNKFQLTPFSRSPEFNVFGKSRIFMGPTAGNLITGPIYQHLGDPEQPLQFWGSHAGVGSNTTADKTQMRLMREPVVAALAHYLRRNDWPGLENAMFRWNLSPLGEAESDQIALNIAAMGYLATTPTDEFGTPSLANAFSRWAAIEGAYPDLTTVPERGFWKGPLSGLPMLPVSPFPHITEITCRLFPTGTTAPKWNLGFDFAIEIHQPPGNFSRPHPDTGEVGYNNTSDTGGYQAYAYPTDVIISVTSGSASYLNTVNNTNYTPYRKLLPQTAPIPHDGYFQLLCPSAPYFVGKNTVTVSGTSSQRTNRAVLEGPATVHVKARFALTVGGTSRPQQVIPIYVPTSRPGPAEARPPGGNDDDAYLDFTFSIPATPDYIEGYAQSREVIDPRVLASKANWPVTAGSLGEENPATAGYASGATQWAMWNFDRDYGVNQSTGSAVFRGSSIGMFSLVPTGVQRSIPFESLRFYDQTLGANELPDWLVLDLLAPTFPGPISLRNSTAGKINLNTKIYPEGANFAPPPRTAPLEALFHNMPHGTEAAAALRDYQDNGGYFDYIGRICEVPGVADPALGPTEFEQETLIRHLASLMTTQSNTFSVWGVAQTVKKAPKNDDYGVFQEGDIITGERRFRAVVERFVWSGKEGIGGNASLTVSGGYDPDKIATTDSNAPDPGAPPTTTYANKNWPEIDGPQHPSPLAPVTTVGTVPYHSSSLEEANNPLAAAMKYRIIFWEYLD